MRIVYNSSMKANCEYDDKDNIERGYVPPYQDGPKVTPTMHKRVWIRTLTRIRIGMETTVSYGQDYWRLAELALVCVFICVYVKSVGVGADTISCLFRVSYGLHVFPF